MSIVPKGKYRARAREWVLTEIGEKGTPAVAVEFVFSDESLGSIRWDGWLSDAAFDRTIESLRHCGWTGDDLSDLDGLDANEVELVVEDDDYNGKTYSKVKWVNRAGSLAHKSPLTGDKAKFFAKQMQARIRALDASKPAPGPRTAPKAQSARRSSAPSGPVDEREPPPLSDDDITW